MKLTMKPGKQNKVHLFLDGEYRMTADSDFVAYSGLQNQMELDEAELADLSGKVNSRRAFNKAAELLSRRDHSKAELLQKLRQKGFSAGAEEAVERLEEYGYLDDRRFAEHYAAEMQQLRHFGKRRMESELIRKGIDREIIAEVLAGIETNENELQWLIERKYARNLDTEQGVRRTVNALVRLGYGYDEIKTALRAVQETLEEDDEA